MRSARSSSRCSDNPGSGPAHEGLGLDRAGGKVAVCHIPPGNPANAHTIVVGAAAVKAHLAHGDYLGSCKAETTPAVSIDCGGDHGNPGTDSGHDHSHEGGSTGGTSGNPGTDTSSTGGGLNF